MMDMGTVDSTDTVVVLAAADDRDVRDQIIAEIESAGLDTSDSEDNPLAIVAVISQSAIDDPGWLEKVAKSRHQRIVPVVVDQIDADKVPAVLSELNWIQWDSSNPDAMRTQLFVAVSSDIDRYQAQQRIESEAAAWEASGRHPDALIQDLKRAIRVRSSVSDPEAQLRPATQELVRDFAEASYFHARGVSRKLWIRRISRVVATAVAVGVALLLLNNQLAGHKAERDLQLGSLSPLSNPTRPDLTTVAAFALLETMEPEDQVLARDRIATGLPRNWSQGFIQRDGAGLPGLALSDQGRILLAGTDGQVTLWDTDSWEVARSWDVSDSPVLRVAISGDGRFWAAMTTKQIFSGGTESDDWQTVPIPEPVNAADLIISATGNSVSLSTDKRVLRFKPSDPATSKDLSFGAVLSIRTLSDGQSVALVRKRGRLEVVDIRTGKTKRVLNAPVTEFEQGALGPSGAVALTGPEDQLWSAGPRAPLAPTGIPVPDTTEALDVTGSGMIALATVDRGVEIIDPRQHLVVDQVCTGGGAVIEIASGGSSLVACSRFHNWQLEDLRDIPQPISNRDLPRPPAPGSTQTAIREAGLTKTDDIRIRFEAADGASPEDVTLTQQSLFLASAPTAVAVHPQRVTVAVGSANGEVVEVDLTARSAGRHVPLVATRWQSPDRSEVVDLDYSRSGSQLIVRGTDGIGYSRPACAGCSDRELMRKAIQNKLLPCYPNLDFLPPSVVAELGMRVCVGEGEA